MLEHFPKNPLFFANDLKALDNLGSRQQLWSSILYFPVNACQNCEFCSLKTIFTTNASNICE